MHVYELTRKRRGEPDEIHVYHHPVEAMFFHWSKMLHHLDQFRNFGMMDVEQGERIKNILMKYNSTYLTPHAYKELKEVYEKEFGEFRWILVEKESLF